MYDDVDIKIYNDIQSLVVAQGGYLSDDDDIKDAIVELSKDHEHFTDDELEDLVSYYRTIEVEYGR